MKIRYILIGIGTFVIIALVMAPARLVHLATADLRDIEISQPGGTLWSGFGDITVRGQHAGRIEWSLNPLQLLTGTLSADWHLRDAHHDVAGTADARLDDTDITAAGFIDAPSVNRFLAPYHIQISGRLRMDGLSIVIDANGRPHHMSGTIEWDGGQTRYRISGSDRDVVLPPLVGHIATDESQPSVSVYAVGSDVPLILASIAATGWALSLIHI